MNHDDILHNIRKEQLNQLLSGDAHMAGGGLLKAAVKAAEVAKPAVKAVQEVLPLAEREENLAKFLDQSRIKDRLYHITPESFSEFKPGGKDPTLSGPAIWLTPDKEFQPAAHRISYRDDQNRTYPISGPNAKFREGVNVMPVHVQAKNPLVLDDPVMIDWARTVFAGGSREFPELMAPKWVEEVRKEGYDSIMLADPFGKGNTHEVIMFEPEKIKSAIGNRGTYDITDPDITKAGGGLLKKVMKPALKAAEAAPQAEALRLAQQRAALPPAKGGLGLAANNTPEQRAAAMGINTDAYHGTKQDIKGAFVPGYNDNLAFVTKDPDFASKWVGKGKMQKRVGAEAEQKAAEDLYRALKNKHMDFESLNLDDPNFQAEYDKRNNAFKEAFAKEVGLDPDRTHSAVYPMKVEANNTFNPETDMDVMAEYFAKNNTPQEIIKHFQHGNYLVYENQPVVDFLKSKGYDSMRLRESTDDNFPTIAVFNPETIRSRFAAFDPFRKTAATAAAMGVAAPDLMAKEQDKAQGGLIHLAGGGDPKKADSDYMLMGTPRQDNENKPYPKTERMNLGVKAVKSGLDKLNAMIDTGPSVRDVLGNVVGAVPFVGPDLRKGMENSTITIPYEFQRSATNPRVVTGVNTAKVPTTDILDALKMSDITGGSGASSLLGSVGKGYAPNPMDVLDTLGLGAAGYSAAKAGVKGAKAAGKGALTAARAGERFAEKAVPKIMERGGIGAEMLGALGQNTQSRAVKQKGGNWVDTELQRSLSKIKQDESYPQSAIESAKEDLKAVKKEVEKWGDLGEQNIMLNTAAQLQRDIDHMEQTNAFNKWVDTKAGSYIRNQMATPDDPVLKMLDARAAKIEADYQAGQKRLAKLDERIAQAPTSTQEERNTLANLQRTRSQRAAEIESDRELAMDSMLPGGKDYSGYDYLKNDLATLINEREKAGFPIAGYAQSDPAKAWEATADFTANINPASKFQGQAEKIAAAKAASNEYEKYVNVELPDRFKAYLDTTELSDKEKQALMRSTQKTTMVEILGDRQRSSALAKARDDASSQVNMAAFSMAEDNPYLAKLPPDTPVYNAFGLNELGIDHVVDVLKDDVASGKLKLEDLNKITMDQALKRAAEYDFEMAKKARDAVAQSRASMPVYKEYPEGYKWVQLTKPGEFNAESNAMGHSVRGYEPERGHPDWTPESGDSGNPYYGHGGWEAIKSGEAKVYSLIDPSGNPHATIEVKGKAPTRFIDLPDDIYDELNDIAYTQIRQIDDPKIWDQSGSLTYEGEDELNKLRDKAMQDWAKQNYDKLPQTITQIKGKGNARPTEKYDPYTQDFVKSGNWSGVGDLRNTGLIQHSGKYFTEPEFIEAAKKYGRIGSENVPWEVARQRHIDQGIPEEKALENWLYAFKEGQGKIEIPDEPNMASGGSVGLKNALNNLLRTDKPEVHMSLGGDAAKAALKAAKVKHPLVFPRAAAKSLEDIRPIAQRIAEQMTGDFVRQHPNPKVSTNPASKSRKQFEREQNIPMETRNLVPPADVPVLDYEKKMGNVLLGIPGDPTLGGVLEAGSLENVAKPTVELIRVGDVTPEHPVPLFGGPRYGNDERFWASNYSAAVPIQNRADKLSELYESPVLGQYIKMAPDSANFALHNLDALLAIQQPEKLPKAKMEKLNREIKAGSPQYGKFPGFVGFKDPIDVLLQSQLDSNLRKHIAETLTKPTITDELGLANGLDVVAAISYPELRNMEAGVSGFSIGELRPKSDLKMSLGEHPTYDTNIPGALIGQSKYPVPSEIAFPDTTAYARSRMTPGVQEFNMLKMLGPRERIDQQYIDEIKMYEELMKQYTGKKKGGLAQTKKVKRHGNTVPH